MKRLLTCIFLVSASAIGYEILLMRMLSIVQWHHFAWMIISLALLGYGISGTVIALGRQRFESRFEQAIALAALLQSVSMIFCLALAQRVPFNALEVLWDPFQFLYLAELYLLFMPPFFFAAVCIGLSFTARPGFAGRIYFADLLGAGLGAAVVIGMLFLLQPQRAVLGLTAIPLAASLLIRPPGSMRRNRGLVLAQITWLLALLYALPEDRIGLRISEFKGLSQALEVIDARVVAERSGPLGMLTVVDSPRVPFRHAPGLSLQTRRLPPDQLAVFTDGDGISMINRVTGDPEELAFLEDVTAALPYRLLERPRVLVLGAGAGSDVLLALHGGAERVEAVELNPQMIDLVRGEFAAYAGNLYEHERVVVKTGEARGYVSRRDARFDLVQLALLDSFAASGAGVQALGESYLYTVEAMVQFMRRLEPGGLLAITRWLKVPPRDSLKVSATLIEAMRRMGIADPGMRIMVVRNWNTVTFLAKNGEFDSRDIAVTRAFAEERSFDMVWYPAMPATEANRYNRLDQPWLYEGVVALLGPRTDAYLREYKFRISPATDDRPYFFNFFKWRTLPELLEMRLRGGAGLLEWGYLVLLATLLQAVVAGLFLILLPLLFVRRSWPERTGGRMGSYFFLLGLAFLFVEMAFIQKFILFLSHPLYSVAVVLAGFLCFAGLGSVSSSSVARALGSGVERTAVAAVTGIIAIVALYLWLLPVLFDRLGGLGDAARVMISLALIAPLAFCMGMPFPLGLQHLAGRAEGFIPWAWGLNGFASVLSAALATLLAIELGFTVVLLLALLFYSLAAIVLALPLRQANRP
jgi:spermidine synthase